MPVLELEFRLPDEEFLLCVAVEEDQLARTAMRPTDAQVIARGVLVARIAAREEVRGHRSRVVRQTVPEPELGGVVRAELMLGMQATAGEMHRTIRVFSEMLA